MPFKSESAMLRRNHYYVYYLLDTWDGNIIYIGRSKRHPLYEFGRKQEFEYLNGVITQLGVCQRFRIARDSKIAEMRAIKKHKPIYNKVYVTHPGKKFK